METVVVTGIRASLQSAQSIKQNADTFVDSITAEDIGALPDQSVTETLARVPGVSINKFAGTADPDHFSAQGSGIAIQGLTYVRSELNGRDTFSANNGRGLSFADVAPELLIGVDVFKNQSPDMIEGGLAGTVNLRTRTPFDAPGLVIGGQLAANYGDFRQQWQPTVSALVSDQWDLPNIGKIGLLVGAVMQKIDSRADGDQASNFACRQDLGQHVAACPGGGMGVWFPRGAAFRSQTYNTNRMGQEAALQWQNESGTLLATFQFLRSESKEAWTEHAMEIATDVVTGNGDSRPVTGTTFGFDSDGVFTNGVITGPTGWRSDGNYSWLPSDCSGGGCDPRTPLMGMQSNTIRRDVTQNLITADYSGNIKWTPNENWSLQGDFQHVFSSTNDLDAEIQGSTYQNVSLDIRGQYPVIHFLPPSADGNLSSQQCATYGPPGQTPYPAPSQCTTYLGASNSYSNPGNSFWRAAMDHSEHSRGTEDAMRLDAEYRFGNGGWLQSAKAGFRWSDRDQTVRYSTYNWGVLSEQWGGGPAGAGPGQGGPVWMNDPLTGTVQANGYPTGTAPSSAGYVAPFAFSNFFEGQAPNPTAGQARPYYTGNITKNYAAYSAFGLLVGDTWRDRYSSTPCNAPGRFGDGGMVQQNWVPLGMRCGVVLDHGKPTNYLPGEISTAHEITKDAYFEFKFAHEIFGGHTFGGNFGMRYFAVSHVTNGVIDTSGLTTTFINNVTQCNAVPPPPPAPPPSKPGFCQLSPAQQTAWLNFAGTGGVTPSEAESHYDYFLPSVNLRYDINDEMLLRFGASRAVSLPDMAFTRLFLTLSQATDIPGTPPTFGGVTATSGNPYLKPIRSDMYDLSYEWYFGKVGSLTATVFWKELHDVITNGTTVGSFTNNGVTQQAYLTTAVNSQKVGTVKGWELAFQRFFDFLPSPFDGLGFNGNVSYISSAGVPQNTLNEGDPQVAAGNVANVDTSKLPLQGLSKWNTNLMLLYSKGKYEARVAYNWRSRFLLTTRDVIVPFAPIMNEAQGQLDGSAFYAITDNIKAGVEAVNILNDVVKTSQVLAVEPNGRILTAPRSAFIQDRRYTFTVRFNF